MFSQSAAISTIFATECEAVSAASGWKEDFNGYTGSTSASVPAGYPDDQLPTCWQFLNRATTTSSYPQVFISSNSGYVVSGNCLFFKSSKTTPLYTILPEFAENISALQLTFTYRNEGTGASNGTLHVGYMTDPADASTFVSVLDCPQTSALTEKDVLFADAPAGSRIAFKYEGGTYDNYYLSIDDVFVGLVPTCLKPAAPKCDAKTAHTATLSWTNGEEGQNEWQIVVDTIAAFNPDTVNAARIIDVASNPAIINGLLSSKTYYAYNGAYGNNQSYFLAHKTEYQIAFGSENIFEIAVAHTYSDKSAACGVCKNSCLLIACSICKFKTFSPCTETVGYVRLERENENSSQYSGNQSKNYGFQISASHKGYKKERTEKYKCRTQIAHKK